MIKVLPAWFYNIMLIRFVADHYPERLGQLFIINAPWVFPTFWRICRVWLDENTVKKIHVLGKNYKKDLAKHIDPMYLPEEYGGTCKCAGGCVHVHDISMYKNGGSIDQELKASSDTQEKTIASRESFELKLTCGPEGGEFNWAFKVQGGRDITFSVQQIGGALEWSMSQNDLSEDRSKNKDNAKPREAKPFFIQEPEKIQCNKGSFSSKCAATIVLKFDNTSSYFTSKTLKFLSSISAHKEVEVEEKGHGLIRSLSAKAKMEVDVPVSVVDDSKDNSIAPSREVSIHEPARVPSQ